MTGHIHPQEVQGQLLESQGLGRLSVLHAHMSSGSASVLLYGFSMLVRDSTVGIQSGWVTLGKSLNFSVP